MTAPHPSNVDPDIPCASCQYSLRGLPADGVCPECAYSIPASIEHAAAAASCVHRTPLPPWLRVARTAFVAAYAVILIAPYVVAPIARALSMPIARGYGMFPEVNGRCQLWLFAFGLALAAVLAIYKRTLDAVLILVSFLVLGILTPVFGTS